MNHRTIATLTLITTLVVSSACPAPARLQPMAQEEDLVLPVYYADQALVVVTAAGIAGLRFTEPIEEGITYRFRFRPADGGEEQTGEGKVFQKYDRIPATIPASGPIRVFHRIDRGSVLDIVAGDISLRWSFHKKESGWIYFSPELERVHVLWCDDFDEVDVSRFAR